jgi:hypothetical protein
VLFDESLEVDAVVEQDGPGEWWARPDSGTYRDLAQREPMGVQERS